MGSSEDGKGVAEESGAALKEITMEAFHESMTEYRKQIEKGSIKKAYQGLMEYMLALRTHFKNKYPGYFVSSNIYFGYMDMTYFSFTPKSFQDRKLKIAVVFVHDTFRFEVWLGGYNKQVQQKYWKVFKESHWNKYRVVTTTKNVDSIVENTLVENPDFSDLAALTSQIEQGTLKFIKDIDSFLSVYQN
jgi:hypothetical protein